MAMAAAATQQIDLGAIGITGYPFTLAGWFRVPNVNKLLTLMGVGNSVTGSYHRLLYQGHLTGSAAAISFVGSNSTANSTVSMTPGQWHHVTGVFESATSRRVYLDGGNSGSSFASRAYDGFDRHYVGNFGADLIEVSDAVVFATALSTPQIALLARGFSPLSLPAARDLLSYQNCLRRLNWPGVGPSASATLAPSVVAHPRLRSTMHGRCQIMPLRFRSPFHCEVLVLGGFGTHAELVSNYGLIGGQVSVAGVEQTEVLLSGEVQS